ncbi:MAG TPA: NAD(P)/FAD-dependent oxidoreductase [Solirubrobacteraceae bacterium]|jgi:monooxygenase|nr:NAD(P)/FAD-dependent oxidoreductase [Solirubrobacteraceae bacterium]
MTTGPEHLDVLIVGAGLSGIGAGYHLQNRCPGRSYAILEARERLGGTWDLFKYPGIRSDSDMYTLGYSFKPWEEAKAIADGPSILRYVEETARENRIAERIRHGHRVVGAEWSTREARWTVHAEHIESGEAVELTCGFLLMCTGYYRYEQGHAPDFPGAERFAGEIVHPQHWPEDLDYSGRRVVVIGSGATAITLVPAMAADAAHVTMLQRSPSYVVSLPAQDRVADRLRGVLPAMAAYQVVRWKNVLRTMASFQLARRRPRLMKALLRRGVERQLPLGYDIDTHFNPRYGPWDQRLCLAPDGDLFAAIRAGRASVVTAEIAKLTERGVVLSTGAELEAEVIVTATGLDLIALGGVQLAVDGREVKPGRTMSYKGMMLDGVPNMAFTLGYTNASWTLKCDLTCEYVCRLLAHMAARGYTQVLARRDPTVPELPFSDFSSGYIQRAIDRFPRQGARAPWRLYQNYALDIWSLKRGAIEDGVLAFSRARAPVESAQPVAV